MQLHNLTKTQTIPKNNITCPKKEGDGRTTILNIQSEGDGKGKNVDINRTAQHYNASLDMKTQILFI